MGQVTVTLNARSYKLRCGDGEELRLLELASHVENRLGRLTAEFGPVGDERILVMVALMIADDLFDAKEALAATQPVAPRLPRETIASIDPIPELPILASFGFDPVLALTHDTAPDPQSTGAADADPSRETALNRTLRRSETPVSINERLADARESATLRSSERKPAN